MEVVGSFVLQRGAELLHCLHQLLLARLVGVEYRDKFHLHLLELIVQVDLRVRNEVSFTELAFQVCIRAGIAAEVITLLLHCLECIVLTLSAVGAHTLAFYSPLKTKEAVRSLFGPLTLCGPD